jgi:hypothetical protein
MTPFCPLPGAISRVFVRHTRPLRARAGAGDPPYANTNVPDMPAHGIAFLRNCLKLYIRSVVVR